MCGWAPVGISSTTSCATNSCSTSSRSSSRTRWTGESWTDKGDVATALAEYEGWHPQVRAILTAVDETYIWALFDRPPLERWSVGRTTLLGDACHPMLPFMAQGAAQAIEDGATLTACLARTSRADIPMALHRYEQLRLPRASRVQAGSATNKTRFHLADGPEQEERDAADGDRINRLVENGDRLDLRTRRHQARTVGTASHAGRAAVDDQISSGDIGARSYSSGMCRLGCKNPVLDRSAA